MNKETQYHTWYWIAAMVAVMVIQTIFASYTQIAQIAYSDFQDNLKAGTIAEVRVSGNYIQGTFKAPDKDGHTNFITTRVAPEMAQDLEKYNVKFAGAIESTFLRDLLSWVVPNALFAGVWIFMYRRFASQQGFGVVYEKSPHSFLGGEMPPMSYIERSYSEATAGEIDATVKGIVEAAFRRTVTLLREQGTLEHGARLLLEHETLDEADLAALRKEPAVAG